MPRMIDVMAAQKKIPVPAWYPRDLPEEVIKQSGIEGFMGVLGELNELHKDWAAKAPVFEVTNCYDYTKQRESKIYEDWPCLMLPLPLMWMEYRRGDRRTPSHVGALLMQADDRLDKVKWEFPDTLEKAKHSLEVTAYFMQEGTVVGPVAIWDVALDERGAPVEFAFKHMPVEGQDEHFMLMKLSAFFQALAFMHCKNMNMAREEAPEKLSKKWQKKTGKPLTQWNTLTIEPLKETLARESGRTSVTGIKPSIHIARGHFAEYGDEFGKGKLFGKYEGRFWIPSHVRGNKEEGIVLHDYEVKV